jgi:hypothetical protein
MGMRNLVKVWHFLQVSSGIIGKHRHRSQTFSKASSKSSQSRSARALDSSSKMAYALNNAAAEAGDHCRAAAKARSGNSRRE